jgi:hypothetical protein
MEPVIKKIIRCLGLGSSAFSALDRGAKNKSRPATASPSKNCCHSEEIGADVSSTGVQARRRRKRQQRKLKLAATETDPKDDDSDQEPAADHLDGTKPSVSDIKNDFDLQDLQDHAPLHAAPSIAPSDHKNKAAGVDPSPEVDATVSSTGPAARRQRQREKRRERKRVATDTKNVGTATGQEHSASDPIPLQRDHSTTTHIKNVSKGLQEPAASHPKPPHLEHSTTGIVLDDHAPLQAPPVDHRDGLHDAALSAAATSTEEWNTVLRKKRRPAPVLPRSVLAPAPAAPPSTSALGHRSPAVAILGRQCSPASVGLLDDLDGVESFFYKLFDEPEDDEVRARHERYLAACSSLKSHLTFCLACFLKDEKEAKIDNSFDEVGIFELKLSNFACNKDCVAVSTNVS